MPRFVIPDVHGCLQTLKALIAKIRLSATDELYFLGDYIDKGQDSAGVLDFIIDLRQMHQVHTLRGNHEENILMTQDEYDTSLFKLFVGKINKSPNLLDDTGKIITKYADFMQGLPYFIELDNFWLVHAAFDTKKDDILENKIAMLERKKMVYDAQKLKGKRVVHGHKVTYRNDILEAVNNRAMIIPLDNGCVYNKPHKIYDHTQTGYLACLNLDSFELIWQENIDGGEVK